MNKNLQQTELFHNVLSNLATISNEEPLSKIPHDTLISHYLYAHSSRFSYEIRLSAESNVYFLADGIRHGERSLIYSEVLELKKILNKLRHPIFLIQGELVTMITPYMEQMLKIKSRNCNNIIVWSWDDEKNFPNELASILKLTAHIRNLVNLDGIEFDYPDIL